MKIKFKYIVKIQAALIREFEALDSDYPDNRTATMNRLAIEHYLDLITNEPLKRCEILDVIEKHNFNMNDLTYKPVCDELRSLGYEIDA